MKKSTKYIIAGLAILILVIHFSLTALYAFRSHYNIPILKSVVVKYGFPFFHQGYQLFVNMPEYDTYIEVSYRENGHWTSFQQIRNRYEYDLDSKIRQFEYLATTKLNFQINNNDYWKDGVRKTDGIENSNDYNRVIYFCTRLERAKRKQTHSETYIDSIQIRMAIHSHPFNREQKFELVEFTKQFVEIHK